MNRKTKKALNITSYVLIGIIFVFALLVIMMTLTTDKENRDVPKLFGSSVLAVQSNSMQGTINKGDLIAIKRLSAAEKLELKEGDIITFRFALPNGDIDFNTHRIMEVVRNTEGTLSHFITKGDNVGPTEFDAPTYATNIIGLYRFRIPALGAILDFFKGQLGFGLLIVLPLFAFLVYRIYIVVKLMLAINKEKKEGTTLAEMEAMQAEIERLKSELKTSPGDGEDKGPQNS